MHVDKQSGLIAGIKQLSSPHHDNRPEGVVPELIVVHAISLPPGQYDNDYIDQFFTGTLNHSSHSYFKSLIDLKVSAHCLIKRDGRIVQYVPFSQRAWHAGVSSYQGRGDCNDYSIGIELEGTDETPFEPAQYQVLVDLCNALLRAYPSLSAKHIVGHSDIAPGRKTDPGRCFDWDALLTQLLPSQA